MRCLSRKVSFKRSKKGSKYCASHEIQLGHVYGACQNLARCGGRMISAEFGHLSTRQHKPIARQGQRKCLSCRRLRTHAKLDTSKRPPETQLANATWTQTRNLPGRCAGCAVRSETTREVAKAALCEREATCSTSSGQPSDPGLKVENF